MQDPRIETSGGVYMATVSQGGKDGYGVASAKILKELRKLGVTISTSNQGQDIGLLLHAPYSLIKMESKYRIVFTMFESDKIPDDWKEYLDNSDRVLVPSKWCQEIFAKGGVKTEVVPLGYDNEVFTYRQRINKRDNRQDFVFLHYNAFNARKGFLELFKAFTQEFKPDEPVKLVLKTTLDYAPFPIIPSMYPNIKIMYGPVDETALAQICYDADCFVFPSRGEGFGMTPLEAMATGMPIIIPNAHGLTEYFNSEFMYEAPVGDTCPALYSRYKNQDVGKMVICDVDKLAKQMRYIYEHQDEALEKGKRGAEYAKNWTFTKTAVKLKAIFDEVSGKPIPERPLRNILSLKQVA
jgi:glycosyltransferase involved in cell wall biosynthesis